MRARFGLGGRPEFLRLWAGQTVSQFGSLVSGFALPLVAVVTLEATPFQIALLSAANAVPAMLVGLVAGVAVDRRRRLPLMIGADLGRAALIATLPLAAALDRLGLIHLYAVVVLTSGLNVLFDVAYRAYLPTLVARDELVDANGKLQASAAVAEVGGFGLGGLLVQALTAPGALVVDAVSFLFSAVSLRAIRTPEPDVARDEPAAEQDIRAGAVRELIAGLGHLWSDPRLRGVAGSTAIFELSRSVVGVVIVLFFVRELDLSPGVMGPLFALGGISALFGALLAGRVTTRWGMGPALAGCLALTALGTLLIPAASGTTATVVVLLALSQLLGDGAATIANINQVSLVQGLTPDRLLGRAVAGFGVLERSSMLLGLLVGGLLGEAIGLRPTLAAGGAGILLASVWAFGSPVRAVRSVDPIAAGADASVA